jgi:hypothetical protein
VLHRFKADGDDLVRLGKGLASAGDKVALEPGEGWENVDAVIAAFYVTGCKEDAYWCDDLECAVPKQAQSRRFEVAFVGVWPDGRTVQTKRLAVR